jgi:hypothetical protein
MVLAIVTVSTAWTLRSTAQTTPTPEALEAARELVGVIGRTTVADMTLNLTRQAWPGLEKMILTPRPDIDPATLVELRREYERLQFGAVLEIMKDAAPIYARHLTVSELRALTQFYRTPAGAKILAVMPQVTSELMAAMAPRLPPMHKKLVATFTKALQKK